MGVNHRGAYILVPEKFLDRTNIIAVFEQVGGKGMAVLISLLPMKGLELPFIIIILRFMENTVNSFVDYDATPVIK